MTDPPHAGYPAPADVAAPTAPSRWPVDPVVHEIDTWAWLEGLGRRWRRGVTLADLPDELWDATLPPGTDAVWLMGVWERSPAAADAAWETWGARARELLPGLRREQVPGSPYSVRRYVVDERLGGEVGLAQLRRQLAARGVRLVLDHVPNHAAPDHPWVTEHPEVVVAGTPADLQADPSSWRYVDAPDAGPDAGPDAVQRARVVACGRDPNLPAWTDTVQLDPMVPRLRELTIATYREIADRCDAIRVDMAMLLLDDVVARTWGSRVAGPLAEPFWVEVIAALRRTHPQVHLIAEAYWDRQPDLLAQGFDRCYDKTLLDLLVAGDAAGVRRHLDAPLAEQRTTLRFVENHDEQRIAAVLGAAGARAAAAVAVLAPGGLLLFEGQRDGHRVQVPVGLGHRPDEPADPALRRWYDQLLGWRGEIDRASASLRVEPAAYDADPVIGLTWSQAAPEPRVLSAWVNLAPRPVPAVDHAGTHDGPHRGARRGGGRRGGGRRGGGRRGGGQGGAARPALAAWEVRITRT